MRSRPLLALALTAVLAAGCGGDDEEAASTSTPAPATHGDTVAVTMKDILFKPEHVTAHVGQTVRWTNEDAVAHNVKAESGAKFESKTLEEGDTYEQKITDTGRIDYVCTIHPSQKGSITVIEK